MRYLSLLLLVLVALSLASPAGAKQMYQAQASVIDMQSHLKGADQVKHAGDLQVLAKSQTVVQRAAETLSRIGVTDPFMVLSTLEIESVKDTNVLLIKVRSESQDIAKATADIVTQEIIRFYDETMENKSGKPALKILAPAATGPVLQFRIFGLSLRALALFVGLVVVGVIVGMIFGSLMAKRVRRKRPEPT